MADFETYHMPFRKQFIQANVACHHSHRHDISSNVKTVCFCSLFSLEILFLGLVGCFYRRERKCLRFPTLQTLPPTVGIRVRPCQQSHPRLHIPMQSQSGILTLSNFTRCIRDLILWLLVLEPYDPGLFSGWIWLCSSLGFELVF